MMSKLEIRIQNNVLEARVIELESKLDAARFERDEAEDKLEEARKSQAAAEGELAELQAYVADQREQQAMERYDDWYKRLHPVPGGEPDLHVARLPIRIIA